MNTDILNKIHGYFSYLRYKSNAWLSDEDIIKILYDEKTVKKLSKIMRKFLNKELKFLKGGGIYDL